MDADESLHGCIYGVSHKEIPDGELVLELSTVKKLFAINAKSRAPLLTPPAMHQSD